MGVRVSPELETVADENEATSSKNLRDDVSVSKRAMSSKFKGAVGPRVTHSSIAVLAKAGNPETLGALTSVEKEELLFTFLGSQTGTVSVDQLVLFTEMLLDIDGDGPTGEAGEVRRMMKEAAEEQADNQGQLGACAVYAYFHNIAHRHRELHLELLKTEHITTVHLLKEFADLGDDKRPKVFSVNDFGMAALAFNTLPLWILFKSWYCSHAAPPPPGAHVSESHRHRVREIFYMTQLHQVNKMYLTIGQERTQRWCRSIDAWVLPALSFFQFIGMYLPLALFFVDAAKVWGSAKDIADFMVQMHPREYCTFWEGLLPLGSFFFLMMAGCMKIAAHDGEGVISRGMRLRNLGRQDAAVPGQPPPEDKDKYGEVWTTYSLLNRVNDEVHRRMTLSTNVLDASRVAAVSAVLIEVFHRCARRGIIGNWAPDTAVGPLFVIVATLSLTYNLYFAFRDVPEVVFYLRGLKQRADVFTALFDPVQAAAVGVPLLNNRKPFNLVLWSRVRQWMQMPNPVQIRWVEGHIICMVTAAVAVSCLLLVTMIQGVLFKSSTEAGDLQLFLAWVIIAFAYLITGANTDVFTAVATGTAYQDDVSRLAAEVYTVECEIQLPELRTEWHDGSRPTDEELSQCKALLTDIMGVITNSSEFIKLYGIPLNKAFRNAIVSFLFTCCAAGVSAGMSLIIKKATGGG